MSNKRRHEARECLSHHGDLFLACQAFQEGQKAVLSWEDWLDLLGRDWADGWIEGHKAGYAKGKDDGREEMAKIANEFGN